MAKSQVGGGGVGWSDQVLGGWGERGGVTKSQVGGGGVGGGGVGGG